MNERALRAEMMGCAAFQLDANSVQRSRTSQVFRDPAGLEMLTRIRALLVSRRGYQLSHARRAKGIEAGLAWKPIKGVAITVVLGVSKRDNERVCFELISDLFTSHWRRLPGLAVAECEVKRQWANLIRDIDATLREDLSVEKLRWYKVDSDSKREDRTDA